MCVFPADCDGSSLNDLTTAEGEDLSGMEDLEEAFAEIGNSFTVFDENPDG